jgi:Tol biopolymer transport system component
MKASSVSMSPDGKRLAFLTFENRGPIVSWMATEGGQVHEIGESETACAPGWASADSLWIARRRNGKPIWTEVDVDTGRETGTIVPGSRQCSDGWPDPASPVDPDLRIVFDQTSQLRLLPREYLEHE